MLGKDQNFSIPEIIIALRREKKFTRAGGALTMHFSANGASVAPKDSTGARLLGLTIAVASVTLVPAKDGEEGSIDASVVNPAKAARSRKVVPTKALQ
jgi:hypothetical protein